jgi:gamma-glutamyltranspeptidase/glutathione hydrolase
MFLMNIKLSLMITTKHFMKHPYAVFILVLVSACSLNAQDKRTSWMGANKTVDPYNYVQVKNANFKKAAVSTAHPLASMVGAETMKHGGNAFDAAVAVQLTLAVVYPGAGNIGGGGFLVGRTKQGKLVGIDYREMAPSKAKRDMYLDKDGNAQTALSQNGHLASGVPGTVAGLFETMKYAKLPINQLIQPAIDLAEHGFVITANEAYSLNRYKESFLQYSSASPAFVRAREWKAGDTLIQKDLAATLRRIRDNGAKGFYEGKTAQLIVDEMAKSNGIISLEDLKNYKAKNRTLLQFDYKGHKVIGFPPPSSGGIILLQLMKMVQKYPMAHYGFLKQQSVQLMVEAERRAYADRAEHLGDPDFWKVPLKTMMSDAYIANRMKDYDPNKASKSNDIKAGEIKESEETTHLSIYDAEGNMVSVTTTLNGGYGSKTVVAGAGFLMNNEMDDFSIKPGVANMFGAVGGKANAIEPGKRMLSSMCPVIVLKNNKPYIVIGTPGGTTIPTSVFQTLMNLLEFNMSVDDAVNKPKFHHQHLPDQVDVEKGFPLDTRKQLELMGYKLVDRGAWSRTEVIRINSNGKIEVAADKRGDDSVAGF